jgi:8-oxo-dGTP diphosphatase
MRDISKDNKAVPASYLVLKKDGKILLGLRRNTGYYDGYWHVPAGHIEAGELPTDCLIREVGEEVGIELEKKSLKCVHVMYRTGHDPTGDRIDYFFEAKEYSGEIENMEPDKCEKLDWFLINDLPENTVHHSRDAIEMAEKGITFSELGPDKVYKNPSEAN